VAFLPGKLNSVSVQFSNSGPIGNSRAARPRRRLVALAMMAMATAGLTSCASDAGSVMTVGSSTFTRDRLEGALKDFAGAQLTSSKTKEEKDQLTKRIYGSDKNQKSYSADFAAFVMNDLMVDSIVSDEFASKKLVLPKLSDEGRANLDKNFGGPEGFAKLPAAFRARVEKRETQFEALLAKEKKNAGDPKAYFEKNKKKYVTVCASHILVATAEEAAAIEGELAKGGDFGKIAKAKSSDTGSGAAGGELGCNPPSTYVPEFAAATVAQEIGKVGEPVKTQFGFHIIKVTKRTNAKYEDVKTQIESELATGPQTAISDALVKRLKSTKITVDPKYAKVNLNGANGIPQIVSKLTDVKAPKAPETAQAEAP
jgi:parvulin-like peptidyl-prolyl isomerase